MFSVWKGPSQNLTSLSHLQTTVTSTEEGTGPRALGISAEDRAGTLQSCRSLPSSHCLPSRQGPLLLPSAALPPCSASSSLLCLLPPPLHFPFAGNNSQKLYTRLLQPWSSGAQGNVSSDWLGGGCQELPRPHFQLLESSAGTAGCWKPPDTYCAPALLKDQ